MSVTFASLKLLSTDMLDVNSWTVMQELLGIRSERFIGQIQNIHDTVTSFYLRKEDALLKIMADATFKVVQISLSWGCETIYYLKLES